MPRMTGHDSSQDQHRHRGEPRRGWGWMPTTARGAALVAVGGSSVVVGVAVAAAFVGGPDSEPSSSPVQGGSPSVTVVPGGRLGGAPSARPDLTSPAATATGSRDVEGSAPRSTSAPESAPGSAPESATGSVGVPSVSVRLSAPRTPQETQLTKAAPTATATVKATATATATAHATPTSTTGTPEPTREPDVSPSHTLPTQAQGHHTDKP